MQKQRTPTYVGQIITQKPMESVKPKWKANAVPESVNTFEPLSFLSTEGNDYEFILRTYAILVEFEIIEDTSELENLKTYQEIVKYLNGKLTKLYNMENDFQEIQEMVVDAQGVWLKNSYSPIELNFIFPLELINRVENQKSKEAVMYIVGFVLTNFGLNTMNNNDQMRASLDFLYSDEEFSDENNLQAYKDSEKLSKEYMETYKQLYQECVEAYVKGNDKWFKNHITDNLTNLLVSENKAVVELIEHYLECVGIRFNINDYYEDINDEDDYYGVAPCEYTNCSVLSFHDEEFKEFEAQMNDMINNYHVQMIEFSKLYGYGQSKVHSTLGKLNDVIKIVQLTEKLCQINNLGR